MLAGAVALYHAIVLTRFAPESALEGSWALFAELGVQGFFITSGALVAGSLARSQSLADYTGKRVRRLYPAYVFVIFVPALISLVLTGEGAAVARYAAANLAFLNFLTPDLPGLFAHNRFTEVNGALWTLKIEVMFYAVLPALVFLMRRAGRLWPLLIFALYIGAEVWRVTIAHAVPGGLGAQLVHQLPGQMAFFAMGLAIWKLWDQAPRLAPLSGFAGAVLLTASLAVSALEPLRAAGLAGVIAAIAFAPGPKINAARFGDISYGLYILHFPVLQALVMLGVFETLGHPGGFALAALIILALSYALWHLIEKPALRPSSHYRTVTQKP